MTQGNIRMDKKKMIGDIVTSITIGELKKDYFIMRCHLR